MGINVAPLVRTKTGCQSLRLLRAEHPAAVARRRTHRTERCGAAALQPQQQVDTMGVFHLTGSDFFFYSLDTSWYRVKLGFRSARWTRGSRGGVKILDRLRRIEARA